MQIDRERGLVESRWNGVATEELLTEYVDQIWTDPTVRSFNELIDFREVSDVEVSSEAVHSIADYSRQFDNPDTAARSAVIAPSGLVFGLSRMFSTIRSLEPSNKRDFQVFEDIDTGRAWLDDN